MTAVSGGGVLASHLALALAFATGCTRPPAAVGCGGAGAAACPAPDAAAHDAGTQTYIGPFRAGRRYLQAWNGERYRNLFLKGVNLGVGVPGRFPGELAISEDQYARWLEQMGALGFNVVRVYTLHYPRLYRALRAYNLAHPDAPLYVLHGVYMTEEDPTGTHDLFPLTDGVRARIADVIDAVHGNADIDERRGQAWGHYDADVSPWTMGYLIGRELEAFEVVANDRQHPDVVAYEGKHLRLNPATPTAAWVAGHFDYAVGYERERYATTRPVGWSNRTELDPLHHPTEPASSRKDVVTLNLSGIDPFDAPARHFESFHAYPYWPNFVHEDPGYRATRDADGVNPYFGYLQELCAYYDGVPALIAEFGVPSSWGRAELSYGGFHHGGLSEAEQAALGGRMARNVFDAGWARYLLSLDGRLVQAQLDCRQSRVRGNRILAGTTSPTPSRATECSRSTRSRQRSRRSR